MPDTALRGFYAIKYNGARKVHIIRDGNDRPGTGGGWVALCGIRPVFTTSTRPDRDPFPDPMVCANCRR